MKKIWLTVAGSFLIAISAVNAQQNSDKTQTQLSEYRSDTNTQDPWSDSNRETVNREDLPSGLLQTLESDEYNGWENATIYRNKVSNDYMLVIQDNGSPKTFYFDKEGKSQTESTGYRTSSTTSDQSSTSDSNTGVTNGQSSTSDSNTGVTNDQSATSGNSVNSSSTELETTSPDQSNAWKNEDKIIVLQEDVPSDLKVTLQGDQYKGWENSTLYQNRSTGEYMIEIRDGSNAKVYYFDKDGHVLSNTGNND